MNMHDGRVTVYATRDNIDYSRHSVGTLCGPHGLIRAEGFTAVTFDWSGTRFMSITQIVGLVQAMRGAASRGVMIKMNDPVGDTVRYVSRMNLYHVLGIRREESFNRHDPGTNFIPMVRLDSLDRPAEVANAIVDMLKAHIGGVEWSPTGPMNLSFSEVMDNVLTHSDSPADGIAAAQYYPRKGFVELCVADSGRGIVSSMGTNPNYRMFSADELMMRALDEGYGQYVGLPAFQDEKTSGGMGLTYATRLTRALDGRMWVVSRNNALEVSGAGVVPMQGMFYPGTIISLRLPVDTSREVMESQFFPGGADRPVTWNVQEGWFLTDEEAAETTEEPNGWLW